MDETVARAKISPAISFHGLRPTWASHAVMNGMPLMVIARNLGHAEPERKIAQRPPDKINDLQTRHGSKFKKVCDYYLAHRNLVVIDDVSNWVPELVTENAEIDEEGDPV